MSHKLIRHYGRGHPHFITFTCYRRLPLLRSVRASSVFVQMLGEVRDRYGFSLVGYAGGAPFLIFQLTGSHSWMVPLQYVNAEELVLPLRF